MSQMNYLALGDSYTIGEAVDATQSWPYLLTKRLNEAGISFDLPEVIAVTGWTTGELMEGIIKKKPQSNFDLVSLLIGVNNQYRDYPIETYQKEFDQLLQLAIYFANNQKESVFVVSIPDYGVTAFGQKKDPEKIEKELRAYNNIAEKICQEKGISFINITTISKLAKDNPDMTADDGLHPSALMYKLWTDEITPIIQQKLSAN